VRTEPGAIVWTFERAGTKLAVRVSGRYTVSSAQLAHSGALAGLGIVNVPLSMVAGDLAAGRLVPVLPAWPLKRPDIHLLYPAGGKLSPRVRALIDLIVAEYSTR